MIALVQRGAARGACEAGHVVHQIPGPHHQLRGGDSRTASGTSSGKQPGERLSVLFRLMWRERDIVRPAFLNLISMKISRLKSIYLNRNIIDGIICRRFTMLLITSRDESICNKGGESEKRMMKFESREE